MNYEFTFIDDLLPQHGEVFVGVIGSPVAKGKLKGIFVEDVLKEKGVYAVYTAKDLVKNRWGNIKKDQPILVDEQIEYHSEPIAIVACESREVFWQAKRKFKLEIIEETPVLDPIEAFNKKMFLYKGKHFTRGNIDKAFKESKYVHKGSLHIGGQEHFYLENQTALVRPVEHMLEVWSSSQCPTETQHVVADAVGLPYHHVTCSVRRLGGGFGGKETQANPLAALAGICAYKLKKSARLVLSKDEDMQITGKRHPFIINYEVGFNNEGIVNALKIFFIADGGAYLDLSPAILDRAHYHADGAYYFENIDIQGVAVKTNHHSNTAMRGFGAPQAYLNIENIIEEIAFILKKDPAEIRLKNLYGKSDRNITPYGQLFTNNILAELSEQLLSSSNYKERRKEIEIHNQNHANQTLRGLSFSTCKFGISFTNKFLNQASSLVNVHLDGSVQVSTGVVEMGQGVNSKLQQIIATELGISKSQVQIMATSTEKNHNTAPTAASTGFDLNGSATLKAITKIKKRLAVLALQFWRTGEFKEPEENDLNKAYEDQELLNEVHFIDGLIYNKEKKTSIGLIELLNNAFRCRLSLGELAFYKTPLELNSPFYYFTQGAGVSEIEIDLVCGAVRVIRTDLLMDLGKSADPLIDRGQITGAYVQSLGWLLIESLSYSEQGELISHSPSTYKIPTAYEAPKEWHIEFFKNDGHNKNIYSSKAAGEPPYLLSFSVWLAVKETLSKYNQILCSELKVPATPEEIIMKIRGWIFTIKGVEDARHKQLS
jgi:xanthine dehydrogenase large subunit